MAPTCDPYRHILLATDFGPDSAEIGARAVDLAARHGARLSVIHVVEYIPLELPNELVLPADFELEGHLVERAEQRLAGYAADLGAADARRYVEIGATKHEILRVAEDNDVDLIVIGSHGRSGLGRLLGSTANAVLHGAPCDVLAVRARR